MKYNRLLINLIIYKCYKYNGVFHDFLKNEIFFLKKNIFYFLSYFCNLNNSHLFILSIYIIHFLNILYEFVCVSTSKWISTRVYNVCILLLETKIKIKIDV